MPNTYKKDLEVCRQRAEDLLAEFEKAKEDFASAYEAAQFEGSLQGAQTLRELAQQIASIFRYDRRRRTPFKAEINFRSDQRMVKLVLRLQELIVRLNEDVVQLNLGSFVEHIDKINLKIYSILERCDDIEEAGINRTLPEKKQIKATSIIKEDFANWKNWVDEEKEKSADRFEEKNDHLSNISSLLGKLQKVKEPDEQGD